MRVLYELAGEPERYHSARLMAEEYRVSEAFLRKILHDLREVGIVDAQRGRTGGYRLAKEPADISVRDILRALEGPDFSAASLFSEDCQVVESCAAAPLWNHLIQYLEEELARLSLADVIEMVKPVKAKGRSKGKRPRRTRKRR